MIRRVATLCVGLLAVVLTAAGIHNPAHRNLGNGEGINNPAHRNLGSLGVHTESLGGSGYSSATFTVNTQLDSNTIYVTFSEPVYAASREVLSKWTITDLTVTAATSFSSTITILDTAENITQGAPYTITLLDSCLTEADEVIPPGRSGNFTGADKYKPRVIAAAQQDADTVRLTFNEPMNVGLLGIAGFFSLDHGLTVSTAAAVGDTAVDLTASAAFDSQLTYTVTLSFAQDAAGNSMPAGTTARFTSTFTVPATLLARHRMLDIRKQYFVGQDDSGGNLATATILASAAEKDSIAACGLGFIADNRALTNTGQYAIGEYLSSNPDWRYLMYTSYGSVPVSDPGLARPWDSWQYQTLTPSIAYDVNGDSMVAWVNDAEEVFAYWVNYCFPQTPGYAFNKTLIDEVLQEFASELNDWDYKPLGFMLDYFSPTSSGYYRWSAYNGELDLDQDGTPYGSDSDEQTSFAAAQLYYAQRLRELVGPSYVLLSNGKAAWPGVEPTVALELNGWHLENLPTTPWYDPTASFAKLWDAKQTPAQYEDYNGRHAASGMPLFFTGLPDAATLESTYADADRCAALLFDGIWNYTPVDASSTVVSEDLSDSTWTAWVDSLGAPTGTVEVTGTPGSGVHSYTRTFIGADVKVTLDASLSGISQVTYAGLVAHDTGGGDGGGTPAPSGTLATSSPLIMPFMYDLVTGDVTTAERDSISGFVARSVNMADAALNDSMVAQGGAYQGNFSYESFSDDGTGGTIETWVGSHLGSYATIDSTGDCYLHYAEDTWICNHTDSGGACDDSTFVAAGARVWNYYPGRNIPYVHTDDTRNARVDAMIAILNSAFGSQGLLGTWFDNANFDTWNIAGVLSGGSVAEAPGGLVFNSAEFNDWYFFGTGEAGTEGQYGVMSQLYSDRDTEAPGKLIIGNMGGTYPGTSSGAWDAYIDGGPIADIATWEFQPKTVLPGGEATITTHAIPIIHTFARALLSAGTFPHFTPQPHGLNGGESVATTAELYRHWAEMLVYQPDPDSLYYMPNQCRNAPAATPGGIAAWLGQMDQPFQHVDLGEPVELHPVLEDESTDGVGQDYRIYSRDYQYGTAIYRSRYGSDETAASEVTLDLGGDYYLVGTDGTYDTGSPITSLSVGNNSGYILMAAGPQGSYQVLQAPTLAGTTTSIPVPIPASFGSGPFRVVKDSDVETDLPVDGFWFQADSLRTGTRFRVYSQSSPNTDPVWPADWVGVYHMDDDPTTGVLTDDGQNGNDLDVKRASRLGWNTDRRVPGVLGTGYQMAAADSLSLGIDNVQLSDGSAFTLVVCCSLSTISTDFVWQSNPGYWQLSAQESGGGSPNPRVGFQDKGRAHPSPDYDTVINWAPETGPAHDQWVMLAYDVNATTGRVDHYYNGAKQSIWTASEAGVDTTALWDGYTIGSASDGVGLFGTIDWNALDAFDGGADEAFLVDRQLSVDEQNALYVAIVTNSDWIVGAPAAAPVVESSLAWSTTQVQIFFDSAIDPTTGGTTSNYVISGSGSPTVTNAKVESTTSVVLQVATLVEDQGYHITINNVENVSGTPVATDTDTSFIIRAENAGAPQLTGTVQVYAAYTFLWKLDQNADANAAFASANASKIHVYAWDGTDYLANEITGWSGPLFSAPGDSVTPRLYSNDGNFPNNQWYIVRVDPVSFMSDAGDTTVTTQGPYSYEKGTSGVSAPTLGF